MKKTISQTEYIKQLEEELIFYKNECLVLNRFIDNLNLKLGKLLKENVKLLITSHWFLIYKKLKN